MKMKTVWTLLAGAAGYIICKEVARSNKDNLFDKSCKEVGKMIREKIDEIAFEAEAKKNDDNSDCDEK